MLLDSNIIIYSAQPENEFLRQIVAEKAPAVSAVSYVEVLGYHRLSEAERGLRVLNPFTESSAPRCRINLGRLWHEPEK